MWKGVSPEGTIAAHDIPAKPLDAYSYYNGDFIALEKARIRIVQSEKITEFIQLNQVSFLDVLHRKMRDS